MTTGTVTGAPRPRPPWRTDRDSLRHAGRGRAAGVVAARGDEHGDDRHRDDEQQREERVEVVEVQAAVAGDGKGGDAGGEATPAKERSHRSPVVARAATGWRGRRRAARCP